MGRLKTTIFVFLGLAMAATSAFGQAAEDRLFTIADFSKMMQSMVNPYLIATEAAGEAINVRANDILGALAKREPLLLYGSAGSFPVKSLHRYYKSDDSKYLIAFGDTYAKIGSDSAGTFTTIRDSLSSGKRWSCETYKDKAICSNGFDNPQKYDGHTQTDADTDGSRTANLLTADLGAPFAELNTGTDLDASSWYQYKIAFYDGSTYSYSSARSNPIETGASVYNVTLTDIPLGPFGTTARYIYRTEGNASRAAVEADTSFYKVATISDNTTTTYDDSVDDTTLLIDVAPTWSTVSAGGADVAPPLGRFLAIYKEHLFIANETGDRSRLSWSTAFNPEYFDLSSYRDVRPDDGDEITFLKVLAGNLFIGKTNTIHEFQILTEDFDTWRVSDVLSFVGCPAPYSVASSPYGLIYLSRDGIYQFNGVGSTMISESVTPEIRDIFTTNISGTVGVYANNEYHLAYTSTESGADANNRVLVFDFVRNAYVIDEKNIDSWEFFDSGTDFGTLYSGSSGTDGKVHAHSEAPNILTIKTEDQFNAGTFDDTILAQSEPPILEIGWGITINDASFSGDTINSYTPSTAIIDRPDTDGTWISPAYYINASNLDKIYWNEDLNIYGDVTFAVRTASTSGGISGASWSSEVTDPNGSDISATSGDQYIQLRASLSTSQITSTPEIINLNNFNIKLTYEREGAVDETEIPSLWRSGFLSFGVPYYQKRIRAINVFYEGDTGELTFRYKNARGDINKTFTIDLSIEPDDEDDDRYTGNGQEKVFEYLPEINTFTDPSPIGSYWQFEISDTGIEKWNVNRIEVRYDIEENYT